MLKTLVERRENEIDILRAHAIAGALARAKPLDYLTNGEARNAWYKACRECAVTVCTKDGVNITTFYDLCGVPD